MIHLSKLGIECENYNFIIIISENGWFAYYIFNTNNYVQEIVIFINR